MRTALLPLALALAAAPAAADSLILTPSTTLDISALGIHAIGDLAFERTGNRLWICDGANLGQIFEVNSQTGALLSTVDPAAIPGLDRGPEALAISNTVLNPPLFVFSPYGESEGGRISQSGVLGADFGTSHDAVGADFDAAGNLWLACGRLFGGGTTLRRIDTNSGAVLQTVVVAGTNSRAVDMTFDPVTGACYVLLEANDELVEVNLNNGFLLSSTSLAGIESPGDEGGLEFSRTGEFLYFAKGLSASTSTTVTVLKRDFDRTICDGAGFGIACPCGNAGLPGHGCDNSFATGGALLDTTGGPAVAHDSFGLNVVGLPPGTSCLFFQGTTQLESTPQVFGDGHRCVAGAVIRLGIKTAVAGAASYPVGADASVSVRGLLPSFGGTRFYQAWYRNVASFCTPAGFNLSNGLQVIWQP